MKAAKPGNTRIGEPRKKDRKATKPPDFTVAPTSIASRREKRRDGSISFSQAAFALSVHDPRELPRPGLPEIAFVGRSNAGKSSAINALANRRRLAFASKTPGRTQLINFFTLGSDAYLVDLPGYGYAGVPGAVKEHWKTLVGHYLGERESLALVVVGMDARHPLTALDRQLLEWLSAAGRKVHVLLTKSDKLSRQAATATLTQVRRELAREYPGGSAQLFSSLKREGVPEVGEAVAASLRAFGAQKTRAPAKGE